MHLNRSVTIVMYHYVRDLTRSRFPAIKGLALERFRRQLDYIQTHYNPISAEQLQAALDDKGAELPPNPILLTFDDGYTDHFTNVFPLLDARGIQGCFFPSGQAVIERSVLDVNKIQFILAVNPDAGALIDYVFGALTEFASHYKFKSREAYLAAAADNHRYDPPEVIVLKRLLQRELPPAVRTEITRRLFTRFVTSDEVAFACELYMSLDQIACLRRHGMHIGSHGYAHTWLNHISPTEQAVEVDRALDFLRIAGSGQAAWTMCYPYGGFNGSLLEILRSRQCRLAVTVEARIANLNVDDRLTLPRLDTNDIPS